MDQQGKDTTVYFLVHIRIHIHIHIHTTSIQFNSIQARSVRPNQIMSENDAPKISAIGADDPFL